MTHGPDVSVSLAAYLPKDRLRALARGEPIPRRATGSALLADLSGFGELTEALTRARGARRGIEELTREVNALYEALITEVERFGGSVIDFAGDAITCWFDGGHDASLRAVTAAFAMQSAMQRFPRVALKIAVTSGPAQRFVVGDPSVQCWDTLAGHTISRLATAERLAGPAEIVADQATHRAVCESVRATPRCTEPREPFSVLESLMHPAPAVPEPVPAPMPAAHDLRPWINPAIFLREQGGHGAFLTELRPTTPLFLRFDGIDFEAEPAAEQLDTFIRRVQAVIRDYDGTLLQLTIGDKGSYLYAAFGAPVAHEDDPRRAVKAALELRRVAESLPFLKPVQVGITCGTMRTGAYGGSTRRAYGVLGDEVNLAARLMTHAAPGQILVSQRVHEAIAATFACESLAPARIKGRADLLPIFAVHRAHAARVSHLHEPAYALPMVGRTRELQTIGERLERALEGKGQVVAVRADAGMGKSRLVAEVVRSARERGFVGYAGAAQADGVQSPYLAWKPIASALFEVDPAATASDSLSSVERVVRRLAPSRVQALPLLVPLLPFEIADNDYTRGLEPLNRQGVLRALLEECFRTAAREAPVLIVLEDLHWLDGGSRTLLEDLAQGLADSRVCFFLAHRPEVHGVAAPGSESSMRLERMASYTLLELPELTPAEAAEVLRGKLARLYPARDAAPSPGWIERLTTQAQGNPFYLEELLNYVHDHGLDPFDPADLGALELPDSLHTLILSRIDRLNEREQIILRVASVIGRSFRAAWLTDYFPEGGDVVTVEAALDRLADLDITPIDPAVIERAHLFKHVITHQATYESLPFATRADLHERFGAYLERQIAAGTFHEAAFLDTLVFHYGRAENAAKEREYLSKATSVALRTSTFTTARTYLVRLLEQTPAADPRRTALLLDLGELLATTGDFPGALTLFEEARDLARTDAERARAFWMLAYVRRETGLMQQAYELYAAAVRFARASGDEAIVAHALSSAGVCSSKLGKLDEAQAFQEESLALARKLGDPALELNALQRAGCILVARSELDQGEAIFLEAKALAEASGERQSLMMALNNLGWVTDNKLEHARSREYGRQALALAYELGSQLSIALYLINQAGDELMDGDLTSARSHAREGCGLALRLGAMGRVMLALRSFSLILYAEGQSERALEVIGLARAHPAWTHDDQRNVDGWLEDWAVDPATAAAAYARGAALDWDTTIRELLGEEPASG
ncbi:MAG: AAA family ATPase [Deltaproteobacteria bacterium]|nr:AAA family ATPase [Deltaproteobacteria bacterium]